jgi:hypothetical protein
MERVKGIEPSYSAWEAAALPLSYTRVGCPFSQSGAGWQVGGTLNRKVDKHEGPGDRSRAPGGDWLRR